MMDNLTEYAQKKVIETVKENSGLLIALPAIAAGIGIIWYVSNWNKSK